MRSSYEATCCENLPFGRFSGSIGEISGLRLLPQFGGRCLQREELRTPRAQPIINRDEHSFSGDELETTQGISVIECP
jgi:hypothetical protein